MKNTFKFIGALFGCAGLCILLIVPVSLVIMVLVLYTICQWLSSAAQMSAEVCSKTAERLIKFFDKTEKEKSEKKSANT